MNNWTNAKLEFAWLGMLVGVAAALAWYFLAGMTMTNRQTGLMVVVCGAIGAVAFVLLEIAWRQHLERKGLL